MHMDVLTLFTLFIILRHPTGVFRWICPYLDTHVHKLSVFWFADISVWVIITDHLTHCHSRCPHRHFADRRVPVPAVANVANAKKERRRNHSLVPCISISTGPKSITIQWQVAGLEQRVTGSLNTWSSPIYSRIYSRRDHPLKAP